MSKPMSEQMQKLADRYEKATGKKFDVKTNAHKIRSMSDEEQAKQLADFVSEYQPYYAKSIYGLVARALLHGNKVVINADW